MMMFLALEEVNKDIRLAEGHKHQCDKLRPTSFAAFFSAAGEYSLTPVNAPALSARIGCLPIFSGLPSFVDRALSIYSS